MKGSEIRNMTWRPAAVVFTIILGLAPEGVAPFIYFQF